MSGLTLGGLKYSEKCCGMCRKDSCLCSANNKQNKHSFPDDSAATTRDAEIQRRAFWLQILLPRPDAPDFLKLTLPRAFFSSVYKGRRLGQHGEKDSVITNINSESRHWGECGALVAYTTENYTNE
ncbi:hypothetical protein AVEN_181909-1 [Araneus ventricosus]|uniref:Uncharacterized protein n=1 Tax=Araneus ventricosus TaxID=182803 RepID=A0A4Y2RTN2_ARAVE|nr:hypothetical protein AVEN_181909-1 [Araneus ventricosus]